MNRNQDRGAGGSGRGHQQRHDRAEGGGERHHRGGGDNRRHGGGDKQTERPKKESIISLQKYIDKTIRVKFQGGREATGKLKGFDQLLNLVLDDTVEYMRDSDDSCSLTQNTRNLGLVVCRGPAVTVICPQDGHESIPNPFIE